MLDLFGTNIRDHELLALSKRFHFLDVDLGFCKELTSHGLCSFFEEQPCLGAIGAHSWKGRKEGRGVGYSTVFRMVIMQDSVIT